MIENIQRFESSVWFNCPKCGEHISTAVAVPEPNWAEMERSSDMDGHGFYDLSCTECGETFCASVENYGGIIEVRLPDYPQTVVEADAPFFSPDPSYDEEPPVDPHGRFSQAFSQIDRVLNENGDDEDGHDLINRMCFAQYVSAFEAYLADTLVSNVDRDREALTRLLLSDKALKETKLTLTETLNEPDIVRLKVRAYLRNVVYHRMGQVNALYDSALGVKIITRKSDGDALARMMDARHDCVHRSGFTIDGERNLIFVRAFVKASARTLETLVGRVENELYPDDNTLPF